jgi:diguanylate cyclase (GGDEF)-like protein
LNLPWPARARAKLALIGIDLNRFKEINDLRGHKAGDEVLSVLGMRLKSLLHEESGEFVARTGGDEFVAMYRIDETEGVSDFLARLEAALFKPLHFDRIRVASEASLGIAIWPDDAADRESLVNNADLAMYRAKANPLRKVCYYERSMDERVRVRRNLAADLREALADQLSLAYQVQTSVANGYIRGYEALLRWEHRRWARSPRPSSFRSRRKTVSSCKSANGCCDGPAETAARGSLLTRSR